MADYNPNKFDEFVPDYINYTPPERIEYKYNYQQGFTTWNRNAFYFSRKREGYKIEYETQGSDTTTNVNVEGQNGTTSNGTRLL